MTYAVLQGGVDIVGFLKSRNRKVDWKDPKFIDGVAHYPIVGARTITRWNDNERWVEYATAKGDTVLIDGEEIKGHLGRLVRQEYRSRIKSKGTEVAVYEYAYGPKGNHRLSKTIDLPHAGVIG